jgi:hypothetical protein
MKKKDYVTRTVERIKDLDRDIDAAILLGDKTMISIQKDTRRSNYMLYFILTEEVYPHAEERLQ